MLNTGSGSAGRVSNSLFTIGTAVLPRSRLQHQISHLEIEVQVKIRSKSGTYIRRWILKAKPFEYSSEILTWHSISVLKTLCFFFNLLAVGQLTDLAVKRLCVKFTLQAV